MKTIATKYHGPTNSRGARISADDGDNRLYASYDHASGDPHVDAAKALCVKLGWHGRLIGGDTKTGKVFVFENSSDAFEV